MALPGKKKNSTSGLRAVSLQNSWPCDVVHLKKKKKSNSSFEDVQFGVFAMRLTFLSYVHIHGYIYSSQRLRLCLSPHTSTCQYAMCSDKQSLRRCVCGMVIPMVLLLKLQWLSVIYFFFSVCVWLRGDNAGALLATDPEESDAICRRCWFALHIRT